MEKVKLPRNIADVIDYFKDTVVTVWWEQAILKVALDEQRFIGDPEKSQIIKDYVNSMDNLKLFIKAIANGYEVEETPEDKINNLYIVKALDYENPRAYRDGILDTLNIFGFKIEGIN